MVKTGAKFAYAAPLLAATMKLGARGVEALSGGGIQEIETCNHGTVTTLDGRIDRSRGCMQTCTSVCGTGNLCNDICGDGHASNALCPVGSGDENPCCGNDACSTASFRLENGVCNYRGTCGTRVSGGSDEPPPPTKTPKHEDNGNGDQGQKARLIRRHPWGRPLTLPVPSNDIGTDGAG